jgi:FKBP-type peptidyl-prolyl cis-trans isomerase 2
MHAIVLILVPLTILAMAACGGDSSEPTESTPEPTREPTAVPTPSPDGSRVAESGDTVSVHYRGTLDGGEVFDSSRGREPLTFTLGSGQLIPGFDKAVHGMAVGDTVTVRIEPEDAYGQYRDDLIVSVPRQNVPDDVEVGDSLQSASGGGGGVVVEVTDTYVRIDANPELAGKALTFEIEVVTIK